MRESLKFINRSLSSELIGAEIGVRTGDNALVMLTSMNIKKLYLIDHYRSHIEHSGIKVTDEQQLLFYKAMFQKLTPFIDKIHLLPAPSALASTLFEDNFFDFVYIDAGHRYEQVLEDMNLWYPKVRSKGILCGHDFNNKCTPDVIRAVKDFCKLKKLPIYNLGDIDWITIKE